MLRNTQNLVGHPGKRVLLICDTPHWWGIGCFGPLLVDDWKASLGGGGLPSGAPSGSQPGGSPSAPPKWHQSTCQKTPHAAYSLCDAAQQSEATCPPLVCSLAVRLGHCHTCAAALVGNCSASEARRRILTPLFAETVVLVLHPSSEA